MRKMFLAMAKDIRVILIKLADRLHNMRTLQVYDAGEAAGKSAEKPWTFTRRSHSVLVSSKIKVELDDLSLKYLTAGCIL